MEVDFLIIGQGLAGSALAISLIDLGASVLVLDRGDEDSASRVAAGLVTTVAGKGMNVSWGQAEYLSEALAYYRRLEGVSGEVLFHEMETLRLFDDEKQRIKFLKKRDQLEGWVSDACEGDFVGWNAGYGGFLMSGGGRLDTKAYLRVVREMLGESYREGVFTESDIELRDDGVSWSGVSAKRVIFCQGARGLFESGLFSYLDHRCAKGEILAIEMPGACERRVVNRNGWMIPMGGGTWRVGATYEWEDMSGSLTEGGKGEIEARIRAITDMSYRVVGHTAGVRPIMRNSQPYVGFHPDHSAVGFFNGLGSKGVTTAPSVGMHFARHLVFGSAIDDALALK